MRSGIRGTAQRKHPFAALALFIAIAAGVGGGSFAALEAADQQESYSFTLGLMGGIGGSFDAEPDPGLDESAFMIQAGLITEPRTLVSVRAGRLKLGGDEPFESYSEADLEFVNIAGEYRFAQSYYDYGIYLGVGYYRLEGELLAGGSGRESDLGAVVGMTGDFDVTRHLSVIAEFSAHYVFIDSAAIYGMATIGLAVHF